MAGPNKEIGIFDAIYSLMEHEHRLQGAELSGQRVRALQAGNADLFNQTTAQIGQTDAKLLFILQKRGAQAAEFEEKGIAQPGLSMAEKLHEYMQTLSGGALPRTPTAGLPEASIGAKPPAVISSPDTRLEASNGHTPIEAPLVRTEFVPPPPAPIGLPPVLEQAAPTDLEPTPPAEPVHPLAEFKELIPEEPSWDIPSRPLTQKLESGRFPFGIRQARFALASVKYGVDLDRLNAKRPRAVQEAYSDGAAYAPVAKAAADSAVRTFVNDFMIRKGKKLMDLPQETQDTILRIKEDPILGPLSRSAKGRTRLLGYALYEHSLSQVLLGGPPTPEVEEESPKAKADAPKKEKKAGEPKMPELAPQQLKTVQTYLSIYIQRGWPSDMRRAVALDQYQDDIPRAASVSDIAREEVITNKMGSVARERVRAEKKLVEAAALMEQGAQPSATIQAVEAETARMLGVDKVTLAEVLDLLNKRVTPEQLRQKAIKPNSDTRQPGGSTATETGQGATQILAGTEASAGAESLRNPEDLQVTEEAAFYSLLALNENGLAFETVEEACASAYREELDAITDPQSRMVRFELLRKQFAGDFNKAINRIEYGRSKGAREHQAHLSLAMDWLNDQEIDGQKIYETRESSTLRRIGAREVDLSQYLRKPRTQNDFSEQRDSVKRWSQILP